MNWGKSIVLAFIGFAMFIGVLVTICVKQNVNLVSKDYYKEELNYQEQIDQLANAEALLEKPRIVVTAKHLQLVFSSEVERGELKLLRPSDARFDASFAIDSTRRFDLSKYPTGRYNASLQWESGGRKYLMKEAINL